MVIEYLIYICYINIKIKILLQHFWQISNISIGKKKISNYISYLLKIILLSNNKL